MSKDSTEVCHLTSLANGRRAYVHLGDGRSLNVDTRSDDFVAALNILIAEGHSKRVSSQINTLANTAPMGSVWPQVRDSLVAAEVFN